MIINWGRCMQHKEGPLPVNIKRITIWDELIQSGLKA